MSSQSAIDPSEWSQTTNQAEGYAHRNIRRVAWAIGAIGILLVGAFDLGPPIAINDDWVYAWDVRHFNPLHIHLYPTGSALALVQIVWAWAVTMGHTDQRLLRLTIVPFIILTMYALYKLTRLLKVERNWSVIAALSPLAFPVFMADATAFMSEVPYLALFLLSALGAARWTEGRKWISLCIVAATLATLQRQVGLMIPVAVTFALFLRHRDLRINQNAPSLALLWGGCLISIVMPMVLGTTPPTQGLWLSSVLSHGPAPLLTDLLFLPGMIGLALILFLPGLVMGRRRMVSAGRTKLWISALLLWELLVFLRTADIFPGNVFESAGFMVTSGEFNKPQVFALAVYLTIEVVAVTSMLLFVWRWRDWWPAKTDRTGSMILALSVAQILPLALLPALAFDRYYLPALLILVPLVARAASQTARPVLAQTLALFLVVAGLAIYAVAEQDYQASAVARRQAACLAYQYVPRLDVNAGYEANAVYVEVPYYEQSGKIAGGLSSKQNFSLNGPKNPIITIEVVAFNDPRPGYNYTSLASGKAVLVTGVYGYGIDIKVPKEMPKCSEGG